MPKIKFLDSVKNKRKSLVVTHTEEDIVLNLPKESGTLVTDRFAEKKVKEANQGNQQNVTFILKPDITENNGGVTTSNWDEYFKIASYRTSAGFLGKHTGTEWVAYSDSNLTTLVDRSSGNILHKDKWKPNTNTPNLNLYVRYRFVSNYIYSPWSDSIHVVTAPGGISPFDVSVEENTLTPLCTVSAFNAYGNASGANHVSTSWVVYEANGESLGAKVIESLRDTTNKMNFRIPNRKLTADKEYYLEVTLHTDNSNYPNSKAYVRKFTTGSAYIERPVLKYEADNGRHIIKASDFTCSDSSQSLVNAVWKLYNADNNTLINTITNTSKEYDITIFVNSKKKYYATLVYKSNSLTSPEGKCVFIIKGSKADEITASFDTSTDKLPILKLSKFYIPSETDKVKYVAYKSYHKDRTAEEIANWFTDAYNTPMEHTFTNTEFENVLDKEKEWDNSPLTIKGYVIGEKYNSDIYTAVFTPNISLNYKVTKTGEAWDDINLQVTKDDSINPSDPTPNWINVSKIVVYGDKITTPLESATGNVTIPNNGYEYNKDYHFTVKAYTSIGVKSVEHTIKLEGGKISDPDMAIEAKHAYGEYVNMKVKGTEYGYSRPIDSTNGLKEIKLTIQDTSDNNKVVYETIQTVTDKGPAVYNFDINYDKDHLDKSLKHNTKYLVSIEYKNNIGERSKRVSKEFTTLQRDELTIQDFEIQAFVYSKDVTIGGVTHMIVGNVILTLGNYDFKSNRFEYAFTTLHKKIVDENIEKMIVTIKALDGTTLLSKEILRDDLQKSTGTSYPDIYSDYEQARYRLMYLAAINSEAAAGRVFNNPVFKANNVYEISFALVKEDNRVEKKIYLPIMEDNRFNFDKLGTSRGKMLDNNPLRYELWKRTIINNPNLPEGTIIDANKTAELLKEHLGPVIGPKTEVLEISLVFNNKYSELSIVTDFKDPSKNKAVLKDATALEDFMPNPRLHRLPSDTNRITKVYDYNKLKPTFYVGKEGTAWYLYIKYVLFPKEIMHEDGYIHFLYRNGTYYGNIPEKRAALVQGAFDVVYEYTDPSNNKHILNIPPVNTGAPSISLINSYVSRKNMPAVWSTYLTTKEYIDGDVGLSDIPADNYKIYGIELLGAYNDKPYGSEFLEQIPYNGGMFILPLKRDLLFGNMTPLLEEDNLICQKDPLAGIHFKIYKINPDNTETLVPGIEDAFSAGVSFGIPDTYDILGKWTKPVNKRPVLEPGEKYRVKIWFVIANNFFFNDDWYVEKVFVAYKKETPPPKPRPIMEPNKYNRLLEPVGTINYPLGDLVSFDVHYPYANDFMAKRNGIVPGRDTSFNSITDVANGLYQNNGYNGDKEEAAFATLVNIYTHTYNETADKNKYEANRNKIKSIKVDRKITSISGINKHGDPSYFNVYFKTTEDISDFNLGVVSPSKFINKSLNLVTTGPVFEISKIINSVRPTDNSLQSESDRQKVIDYKDTYDKLEMETTKISMYQWNNGNLVTPPDLATIKNAVINGKTETGTGWMCFYFDKPNSTFDIFYPRYNSTKRENTAISFGEELTFTIEFIDGKVDTYRKIIPDWTKEVVVNKENIIKAEHLSWGNTDGRAAAMPSHSDNLPSGNEDVIKTLYIHGFTPYAEKDVYGSDVFNLTTNITRATDPFYGKTDYYVPLDETYVGFEFPIRPVNVFYRYGAENSKWYTMRPGKTPPVNPNPLYTNAEYGYFTVSGNKNNGDRNLNAKRSTYYNIVFTKKPTALQTSAYYQPTTYDMIAIMFYYTHLNVYNLIYYRVNRDNGDITYHEEDQNITFKYEWQHKFTNLSNKAKSFVHAVKDDGSVIEYGNKEPAIGDDNIDVTMFGHIFLQNQGSGSTAPLVPIEQMMQCKFNNDYSKENIGYVGTAFVTFKDPAGTSLNFIQNRNRNNWLSGECPKLLFNLKDQLSSSAENSIAKEYTNISDRGITSGIDVKIHMGKNWVNSETENKLIMHVYENCLPYSCNRYYSSTYQNEITNIGLPGNNVTDEAGKASKDFNYREVYEKLKEGNLGELTYTHLMLAIITKAKPGEKAKAIIRVFPMRMLSTAYSNAGVLKYCLTINKDNPSAVSMSFSKNNIKELNYASVTTLSDLFTYFKYTPPVISQFHGQFNTIIRKYTEGDGSIVHTKETDMMDMALTNSNVMYNKYYKPTGILDPAQEYETLPVWHTDLKAKSWNIESIKAITPVPMFPALIIDDMDKQASKISTTPSALKTTFLNTIGSFIAGRVKSIRIHIEATAACIIDRKGNNTFSNISNNNALTNTGYYYPDIRANYPTNPAYFSKIYFNPEESYRTFRHNVIYSGAELSPSLKIKNGPTSGEVMKYPLMATGSDAQMVILPRPTVSTYAHTESNNVNDIDTNRFRGAVSHFWARPQNLGTNTDPVTFISEDCASIFLVDAYERYTYYFLHMANPLKLCLANLPFIRPEALEINVYKGALPLPTASELILAVKVYKFNKFIDKDLQLASTSTTDVKNYHEKIERIAYNATSSFMLRTDINSRAHNVPEVYYRKGSINSPLMKLDRILLTDPRLDAYKECDKYLREDTCNTPHMAKGVIGYYTFNSEHTKLISINTDGKRSDFKHEPYDLLVVRYPMVFGIKNNAAPYEQFVVYRVDPSTGEITSHPEDQGRILPFLTRPYDFSGTETYGTVDITKTVVAPRSNLGAEGMMMNHDTFGSIMPPVVMGPNGPKLPPASGSAPIPPYLKGAVRYVVDEEMVDDNGVAFKMSYIFIKYELEDITSVLYKRKENPNIWVHMTILNTPGNKYGYTYGEGYWIGYQIEGTPSLPAENFSPEMKLKFIDVNGDEQIYNSKLGNFKRSFTGGKEYEAILTPATD